MDWITENMASRVSVALGSPSQRDVLPSRWRLIQEEFPNVVRALAVESELMLGCGAFVCRSLGPRRFEELSFTESKACLFFSKRENCKA